MKLNDNYVSVSANVYVIDFTLDRLNSGLSKFIAEMLWLIVILAVVAEPEEEESVAPAALPSRSRRRFFSFCLRLFSARFFACLSFFSLSASTGNKNIKSHRVTSNTSSIFLRLYEVKAFVRTRIQRRVPIGRLCQSLAFSLGLILQIHVGVLLYLWLPFLCRLLMC